ncbi:MAG: AMP-binding protein [Acaryochloridaceae cyanobacterium RU_4_10]|nr:AMP-binding protein [Acaryochloridaceae cyanobacterium RU_4_10]
MAASVVDRGGIASGSRLLERISQDRIADLRLPFEHPVTQDATFRIEAQRIEISTANIRVFARQQQTSVRDVLLACWMVLVGRLTEAQTLTMGYGCDGRSYPELQALLGVVATWVPLHCPITLNLQFAELLSVLSEQRRAVEEWQDYFDWNGDSLNPSLVPSFFPIGFEFESGSTHWTHKNLAWRLRQYHACIERFKLKLVCTEQPDTLDLAFYADARQFAPEAIGSLAQQFQALLTDAIAHPHQPIGTLNLLSAWEREALFAPCDLPPESDCVHRLFEAQAQQHPDAVALVYEDQRLTYAQLNRQANQLAHYLQTLGVGIESIVGIYMGRSPQSIVALLAVLKAGGAYLPLDPVLPTAAIATRLQQAQASWAIAEQALSETLPPLDSALGRICLDREADAIAQAPESNPTSAVAPENLMYVLFTSGTTGQPKGIAIEHRQLYHYLRGILEPLDLPAGASFATVSTLAADLGNTAIFPALCTGGCLHLISQDRLSDPVTLGAYIQQHRIDCLKIVPSHLQALLNTANPAQLLPQRCLVLGGEALSWELVAQLQALQPHCRILNHYGPTETTVGVLTYTIPSQPGAATLGETVPLRIYP